MNLKLVSFSLLITFLVISCSSDCTIKIWMCQGFNETSLPQIDSATK